MNPSDLVTLLAVSAPLGVIAWHDLTRFEIPPEAVAALVAGGVLVHDGGSPGWWLGLAGAAFGLAAFAAAVAAWVAFGRRWPLLPGDAGLLAGLGWVLGPLGLAWALAVGAPLAMLHRLCLQRRRRRRFRAGYTPLAPGLAAGALAVFLAMEGAAGEALTSVLEATQLGPAVEAGPPRAGDEVVAFAAARPLAFGDLAGRIARAIGREVVVEERPARSAGSAMALPPAPPLALVHEGPLGDLLDRVAAESGYRWTWRGRDIVFYRYWDREWHLPPGAWDVDRSRHRTLKGVLEAWAGEAGWSLDWKAGHDYAPAADARFQGSFLEAVDALLADPATRRTLVATAFEANRHLVVEEAR